MNKQRFAQPSVDLTGQPLTLDTEGAAAMMKSHPKKVLELIESGELPAVMIGKGYVMLTRDVVTLIERRIAVATFERMGIYGGQGSERSNRRRRPTHAADVMRLAGQVA
jgi:hypothetical protein